MKKRYIIISMESDKVKYIETKRGSVLAVVVTFLVMIAVLSATLIVLLEKEIIFINPNYIVSNNDINNGDIEVENKDDINSIDLSKYQGIINGSQLRNLVQDVINKKMTEITIYQANASRLCTTHTRAKNMKKATGIKSKNTLRTDLKCLAN